MDKSKIFGWILGITATIVVSMILKANPYSCSGEIEIIKQEYVVEVFLDPQCNRSPDRIQYYAFLEDQVFQLGDQQAHNDSILYPVSFDYSRLNPGTYTIQAIVTDIRGDEQVITKEYKHVSP